MTVGITWRAEYMLGVLEEDGEVKMSYLRHIGLGYDIKDTLHMLEAKGFVKLRRPDDKMKLVKLTDYGREYVQQVKELYK